MVVLVHSDEPTTQVYRFGHEPEWEGCLGRRLGSRNETATNLGNTLTSFLLGQAPDPIASESRKARRAAHAPNADWAMLFQGLGGQA